MEDKIFEEIRKLNLPSSKYVIFGSGPMGIRRLRKCHDIDIIITKDIWDEYVHNPNWEIKVLSDGSKVLNNKNKSIELGTGWGPGLWDTEELIKNAEIIDGLAFANIEDVLKWKKIFGREKDLRDVEIIENYIKNKK